MEDLKPRYQIIQLTVMKKDETGKDGDADELLSLLYMIKTVSKLIIITMLLYLLSEGGNEKKKVVTNLS